MQSNNKFKKLILPLGLGLVLITLISFSFLNNFSDYSDDSGDLKLIKTSNSPSAESRNIFGRETSSDLSSNSETLLTSSEAAETSSGESSTQDFVLNYTSIENFDLAKNQEDVNVLFFKASWCSTCSALDKNIDENIDTVSNNLVSNVNIIEVDFDKADALKKEYKVITQHTLVQVDKEGKEIKKWTSSPTLSSLLSNI